MASKTLPRLPSDFPRPRPGWTGRSSAEIATRVGTGTASVRRPSGPPGVPDERVIRHGTARRVDSDEAGWRRPASPTSAVRRAVPTACVARSSGGAGWLVLVAGVTLVIVVGMGWPSAVGAAPVPQAVTSTVVRPGETLWEVAERVAPDSQPGAVIDRIRQLNGLSGSVVYSGEVLDVPDGIGAVSRRP